MAEDDEHAISITRSIVANLNLATVNNPFPHDASGRRGVAAGASEPSRIAPRPQGGWEEPLFDPREMGSIIPTDPKKPFDVRKVREKRVFSTFVYCVLRHLLV